jgi:hypothetical protein
MLLRGKHSSLLDPNVSREENKVLWLQAHKVLWIKSFEIIISRIFGANLLICKLDHFIIVHYATLWTEMV